MKFINTANHLDYNKNNRLLLPQIVCGSADWKLIGLKHSIINFLLENAQTPIISNPAFNSRSFYVIYRDRAKTVAEEFREAYGGALLSHSGSSVLKGVNYLRKAGKLVPLYSYIYRKSASKAQKVGNLARNIEGSRVVITLSAHPGAYRSVNNTVLPDKSIIQCVNGTTFGDLAEVIWRGDLGHAIF
ncbi:hypothetical protein [Aliikangiella sp. G2MR2-5]|uniref:hypothetical protein n=1 Tax=Aliikangiella sp. G2MR2-5 TaxID=2788943 RepID=UPI0018AB6567|nr:hypothetical protein [Aliikangiella sp. G2MR2-5]